MSEYKETSTICPGCGREHRAGLNVCPACGAPLAADKPESEPGEDARGFELSTVLATSDAGLIAVAKSLLDDAGIPFMVRGEGIQGLFPGNLNVVLGPAELQVNARDRQEAKAILSKLSDAFSGEDDPADETKE
jgi:hypothetical protein